MLTVFVRAVVLFIVAVVAMRGMGKRQVGQLQPFELVIAIMIAELAAAPMGDLGVPLLYGIVPMAALVILHSIISVVGLKSQGFREFVNGKPSVLIRRGEIQKKEMERLCINMSDLLEELRGSGILNPLEVGTAVLETSGRISVFPHANQRPLTPDDMDIDAGYEGIPLTLVLDGEIQFESLIAGGLDENWLRVQLEKLGMDRLGSVLLCSLDTKGVLFVQTGGEKPRLRIAQALEPDQVGW